MQLSKPLVVPRAAQVLADTLKDEILSGRVRPGDTLPPPEELSRQYGLSRPTVREALALLGAQGLVRLKRGPKGGAIVQRLDHGAITRALGDLLLYDSAGLAQLVEARVIIEPAAARLAASRITDDEVAVLRASIEKMEAAVDNMEAWMRENLIFHAAIAVASRNQVLRTFMDSLRDLIYSGAMTTEMTTRDRSASLEEHRAIVAALARGDAAVAEQLMDRHLRYSIYTGRHALRADEG